MTFTLADVLTLEGAITAAGIVTGLIELLKRTIPIIGARGWEQALALLFSLALVVLAFVDAADFTLPAAFWAFMAWLAIAKLATGIYDEFAQKSTAIIAPATAVATVLVLLLVLPAPVMAKAQASVTGPDDNLMTFGPTPSWAGGGASCTVELI